MKKSEPLEPPPRSGTVFGEGAGQPAEVQHRWTFLTNHTHVLVVLAQDPDVVLREVAVMVGITERAVQRIIVDLEDAGYLIREKVGRQNRYIIRRDRPLRHPLESNHTIGELLELIIPNNSPSVPFNG